MKLLDGKKLAHTIKQEIAKEVEIIKAKQERVPHLAAILVGNDGASETYVNHKVKACKQIGFDSTLLRFESDISEAFLLNEIEKLNQNPNIDGFIVQMPLPKHISADKVIQAVDPKKDVDGFHPINVGRMAKNLPTFISATPFGILTLLNRNLIKTNGKHCVVVGRSQIVGSPISILMARNSYPGNCTVTLCHSRTQNIAQITQKADILIVALGKPGFITSEMVKENAVVIDVGITRVLSNKTKSGYKLLGDVAFDEVAPKCSFITPVPGGVGPMTIAMLLTNTLKANRKEIYS